MSVFTHNGVEYEIAINHGQVGDLEDHKGQPVVVYYSRVRLKPIEGLSEDNTGWVLVMDGDQAAIARNAEVAQLQAQVFIQQQAVTNVPKD
jgi:hypothetical protein